MTMRVDYNVVVPEDSRPRHEDNQSQRIAIRRALADPFTLIQGPPGKKVSKTISVYGVKF